MLGRYAAMQHTKAQIVRASEFRAQQQSSQTHDVRSEAMRRLCATVAILLIISCTLAAPTLGSGRPPPYLRKFVSPAIDQLIANLTAHIKVSPQESPSLDFILQQDSTIAALFSNCLPNTLDTTVQIFANSTDPLDIDTYIVTG